METSVKFLKMLEELMKYDPDMYLDGLSMDENNTVYVKLWNKDWDIQGNFYQMHIPIKSIEEANSTSFIKNTFIIHKYNELITSLELSFKNLSDSIKYNTDVLIGLKKIESDDEDYLYILNKFEEKVKYMIDRQNKNKIQMAEYHEILMKAEVELLND